MLKITREQNVHRRIKLKKLFNELNISNDSNENDFSIKNKWNVKILTPYGYKDIEGFYVSEKLSTRKVTLANNRRLRGAMRHIVKTNRGWVKLEDLNQSTDLVETTTGMSAIKSIEDFNEKEHLFDFQVSDVHCYYSNGIVSHNSMFLVHLGAHALKSGYNVLHYTLELSEVNIGIRYDASLTGISQNDAHNLKDAIKEMLPGMTNGRLFIKSYPTKGANIQTLKNHIRLLESRDFKPDIVIVDYADIMRSTRGFEQKRFELESVYEELRAMGQELNLAIWTASQTNRSGVNSDIIDLDMIGESFAKVQIADVVITFSRQQKDKLKKSGKVYIAKNRIGQDGLILKARIDTETVNISLLEPREDDPELLDMSEEGQEKLMKTTLQEKFANFKRDVGR